MKIGIVIPLKAKLISRNWGQVCRSVTRTVTSVLNQTNSSFRVAVVGHDCPDSLTNVQHSGSDIFVEFDEFAPPDITDDEPSNQIKYETDRCSKIIKAVMYLRSQDKDITHWFALDADDLLHEGLVEVLSKHEGYDAYLFENGYFFFERSGIFNVTNEFFSYCGSSSIISDKFYPNIPAEITKTSFRDVASVNVSHVHIKRFFESNGMNYYTPPERLVMYVRDNGDNISNGYLDSLYKKFRVKLAMLLRTRFLSRRIQSSFSIEP
jgi:hypothetical protein